MQSTTKLPTVYKVIWLVFAAAYLVWTIFFLHWDTYPANETGIFAFWVYPVWIAVSTALLLLFPVYIMQMLCREEKRSDKLFALISLIVGCVFITFYTFLKNPREYTASMIGLDYPWLFKLWGILSTESIFVNTLYMFRRYGYYSRGGVITGSIGRAALFITINVPSAGKDLILNSLRCMSHWTGALVFAFGAAIPVVMLLAHMSRSDKRFFGLMIFFCAVLATALTLLIMVGKDGLIEGVPVWSVYLVLLIVNFTHLFPPKPQLENNVI